MFLTFWNISSHFVCCESVNVSTVRENPNLCVCVCWMFPSTNHISRTFFPCYTKEYSSTLQWANEKFDFHFILENSNSRLALHGVYTVSHSNKNTKQRDINRSLLLVVHWLRLNVVVPLVLMLIRLYIIYIICIFYIVYNQWNEFPFLKFHNENWGEWEREREKERE